jgi:hypothetical protein
VRNRYKSADINNLFEDLSIETVFFEFFITISHSLLVSAPYGAVFRWNIYIYTLYTGPYGAETYSEYIIVIKFRRNAVAIDGPPKLFLYDAVNHNKVSIH